MEDDLIPVEDPNLIAQLEQPQSMINKGAAGGGDPKAQESERTAAFLATRVAGGLATLNGLSSGAKRPGIAQEAVRGIFGDTAANLITGTDRQRAEAAQVDILDAALTLGTGAAYNKEQLEGYRKSYFPQIGDSDATVADKQQRLGVLLQAARTKAGSAAPQIDAALKQAGFAAAPAEDLSKVPVGSEGVFGAEISAQKKKDDEYIAAVQAAFDAGGGLPELNAIADKFGQSHWDGNETLQKAIQDRAQGRRGVFGAIERAPVDVSADRGASELGDDIKAFARGLPAVVGLDDELLAAADVVLDGKGWQESLDYNRAVRDYDEKNNFWARLGGSMAAGAFIPSGVAGAGTRAALSAARTGVGREAALLAGARGAGVRAAQEGAALGGAYGVGATDGSLTDRLGGGLASAAVGAAVGAPLGYGGSRLATRGGGQQALTEGQDVMAAMDRQGITPFAPDVGGNITRLATAGTAQTLGGVGPIRRAAQTTIDDAQGVRDRVASSFGVIANPESAGETARAGARSFIARTSARGNGLYTAAERAAGQSRVETPEALRILDDEIVRLAETPAGSEGLERLQGLREALSAPNTVRGLRNMRTALRDQFETAGLRNSNLERIANRVVDAAADDIVGGLQAQGLDNAARAYRVADRYWRNRLATIDEAIEPVLGNANNPKSGEQVMQSLKQAMAGNNRRFGNFIEALPPQERGTVRASLIAGLGRATKGQQDETGEAFSLATFLTNWNEIGASAKRTLFGDEARAALNDLAIVARGAKQSQRFANTSNTGAAVTTSALGAAALTGPGVLFAAKALAGQYAAGRLLASPRFARWVARMPANPNPTQGRAYIGRLSRIARSEPAIANEVLDLQRRLVDAFSQAPTRAAAGQEEGQ